MDRLKICPDLIERSQTSPNYWVEGAILGFTEELSRTMATQGISRAELARRIGTSPAYVTKVLRGNANLTLASMVKLSRALGCDLRLHLCAHGRTAQWEGPDVEGPAARGPRPEHAQPTARGPRRPKREGRTLTVPGTNRKRGVAS